MSKSPEPLLLVWLNDQENVVVALVRDQRAWPWSSRLRSWESHIISQPFISKTHFIFHRHWIRESRPKRTVDLTIPPPNWHSIYFAAQRWNLWMRVDDGEGARTMTNVGAWPHTHRSTTLHFMTLLRGWFSSTRPALKFVRLFTHVDSTTYSVDEKNLSETRSRLGES